MYKVIIADDEVVIRSGLTRLVNWEEMGLSVVATEGDGNSLLESIRKLHPDLVISDIQMPGMTGLEVLAELTEQEKEQTKFIFFSGFERFAYAREALALGSVDYLLKPVSPTELKAAIQKATNLLEKQTATVVLQKDEDRLEDLFVSIHAGQLYDKADLYELFSETKLDFEQKFFVGLCIGILPKPEGKDGSIGAKWNLQKFVLFNQITEMFRRERTGFLLQREENKVHIMGVFPKEDRENFYEKYVHIKCKEMEEKYGLQLQIGIGMRTEDIKGLKNAYKTAKFAHDLYFFEEKAVIDIDEIQKDYTLSFGDYQHAQEELFRSIVDKDGYVMRNVDKLMEIIRQIHYGNVYAAKARVMHFTGDIGMKLHDYKYLERDFYSMQDELQEQVEAQVTYRDMKACIINHYEKLTAEIYRKDQAKDTLVIEKVKRYMQEHYGEEISVRTLSDLACVSENYFSAMFKRDTGENYKAYLTNIRMEKAHALLMNTEMKIYEIAERVGYNNVRRFVDNFKQVYGMSPVDYKKSRQEEG